MTPVNVLQTITLWSGGLVLSRAPGLVACMFNALYNDLAVMCHYVTPEPANRAIMSHYGSK